MTSLPPDFRATDANPIAGTSKRQQKKNTKEQEEEDDDIFAGLDL